MADPSRIALTQLVQRTRQPNLPAFVTPPEAPMQHLATVTVVDPGRNEVTVMLNDYLNPEVSRVPVRQQGDSIDMPTVGDVVQVEYVGKSMQVVGRQKRPAGVVVFE